MPSPYSYTTKAGDGSTTNFQFQFDYLDAAHLNLEVGGIATPVVLNSTFTMEIVPAPAPSVVIRMFRTTPIEDRVVDFSNGSVLLEEDLDLTALQMLFIAQETSDLAGDTLSSDDGFTYTAAGRRIKEVGEPTLGSDAVTKDYADSIINQVAATTAVASSAASTAVSASGTATAQANRAESEADRAESAADSIDGAAFRQLSDVDDTGLSVGNLFVWNGSKMVPADFPSAFDTGDIKPTMQAAEPVAGDWLLLNGQTIGPVGSSADRASSAVYNLYTLIWNTHSNLVAPMASSGTRGVSALADWNSNKAISVPDLRGRAIIGTGLNGQLSTNREHGSQGGEEKHVQSADEMAYHRHPITMKKGDATAAGTIATAGSYSSGSNTTRQTDYSGSSVASNIMQPYAAYNYLVKV